MIHRRSFLKACAAAGVWGAAPALGPLLFAADAPPGPLLLVVFQRGACDGLHLVGPANDVDYVNARVAELRVPDGGEHAGIALANGLDPALDFRLHPEARPLVEFYEAGELAVLHACGLMNGTRSHFEAQDLIERGLSSQALNVGSGWLTRYLALHGDIHRRDDIAAVSANAGVATVLADCHEVLAVPDLQGGLPLPGGNGAAAVLERLYAGGGDPVRQAGTDTLTRCALVNARLPRQADGRLLPYAPPGANYENNGFTQGLQAVARLTRMDMGLRVACIDYGGWDTHDAQGRRFAALLGPFTRGLAAFRHDLAQAGLPVRIVVMTEFGRRLRSNRSQGTDHGHGSAMLVLGDGVNGGRMLGAWPGLDTPKLDHGVDLAVTTDGRQVLAEVLALEGAARESVFPGLAPRAPVGVLRRA